MRNGVHAVLRRMLCVLCGLVLFVPTASAQFAVFHGDREQKKIAITMDDCFEIERVKQALALCEEYGVVMTFFPLGDTLKAEDAEVWQQAIDAGCEIGNHTNHHTSFAELSDTTIISHIGRMQEKLDAVLGYHYQVRSVRPPFGKYRDEDNSNARIYAAVKRAGFDHVVLWDVQDNDPDRARRYVRNGSILLYHARKADVDCLTALIPMLLEDGYELVTVRELLGFEENTITEELYVYNARDYY